MRLVLHPGVHTDVLQIMEYYETVETLELADGRPATIGVTLRSVWDDVNQQGGPPLGIP